MKNTIKIMFFAVALMFSAFTMAQSTVTGTVMDADLNSPLPSASVVEKGTTNGTTTDFDGKFTITTQSNSGVLEISYVGYEKITVSFNGDKNIGNVSLAPDNALDEVVIVGTGVIDLAKDRKTPVAVSTIRAKEIQQKIGTGDITTTLVNTPSVYVAGQAGGYGDSRISVRGFDQTNTAFLINGQPINAMEDGKMYWSNWSGMSDIASAIQIQRGLGSSKLAISSVGGTVNFVTKATDKRESGFFQTVVANNDYIKTTASYNSGKLDNGFGVSALLTHWQGDGYNMGTFGEGQTYFISLGYAPNENHNLNFLITGAPQWHDQNFSKSISDYLEFGRKYNNNYGYLNGQYETERRNFYHKPVANLNWDWTINDNSKLSTVLYASWGRGGGTGNRGNRVRNADGTINFDAIAANNAATGGDGNFGNGAYIVRASMNNHNWYGLVTNFTNQINENLSFNVGLDARTYYGTHFRQVENFLGLDSWTEDRRLRDATHEYPTNAVVAEVTATEGFAANPWTATFNTTSEDQRIDYDNSERITYGGLFTQLEYSKDQLSAFFQGSVSTQSHQRFDRYDYIAEAEESEKVNNTGFNVKTGANFNIDDKNSVFANVGYYSRQPYHENIYLNFTNRVNPFTENEKVFGLELGYKFRSQFFNANVNAYRTSWKDRVTTNSFTDNANALFFDVNYGVEQLHSGVEVDFVAKVLPDLRVTGFGSVGNWEYVGDILVQTFDEDQNLIDESMDDIDGGKVGDAAQFTAGLGLVYNICENFSVDTDWRTYSNLYANRVLKENLELPAYDLVDAGFTYTIKVGKNKSNSVVARANVNNVFDEVYLSELSTADQLEAGDESFNGINVSNRGYFGLGRTWNFSLRYNF
ncbi:MAG: TonB-dependent receptor [Olleya sp.]